MNLLAGLFETSAGVSRDQFRAFARPALERHPVIQALEWVPRVVHGQRTGLEEAARQEGLAQFQFTELDAQGRWVGAAPRAEYFPVLYVEPERGNEQTLGCDLASQGALLAALSQARDTGRPATTGRLELGNEPGGPVSFLVFVPAYESGLDPGGTAITPSERGPKLRGFTLGAFGVRDWVETVLRRGRREGIEMQCFDQAGAGAEQLLYSSIANEASVAKSGGLRRVVPFELAACCWITACRTSMAWSSSLDSPK